jgi:hypothetical protein
MRTAHWWLAVLILGVLTACRAKRAGSGDRRTLDGVRDAVLFVHFDSVVVPLACHVAKERRFASGADCLGLMPSGAVLFSEAQGEAPSRPSVLDAYDRHVNGLAVEQKELTYNGFSIWPPEAAARVKRIAQDKTHPLYLHGELAVAGPDPAADPALLPPELALLERAGRQALSPPASLQPVVRQVALIDLDHDGQPERLIALGFRDKLGPDSTNDERRDSAENELSFAGLFLMTVRAPVEVRLLRRHAHTILGTVDLAGDGRLALWLAGHDSENFRYRLELFQGGKLLPIGCFGSGPGNGPYTDCEPL